MKIVLRLGPEYHTEPLQFLLKVLPSTVNPTSERLGPISDSERAGTAVHQKESVVDFCTLSGALSSKEGPPSASDCLGKLKEGAQRQDVISFIHVHTRAGLKHCTGRYVPRRLLVPRASLTTRSWALTSTPCHSERWASEPHLVLFAQ